MWAVVFTFSSHAFSVADFSRGDSKSISFTSFPGTSKKMCQIIEVARFMSPFSLPANENL